MPRLPLTQSLDVSEKDAAMAAVFEPDIGTRAFWYKLEAENERHGDSLAQSGRAKPWISFLEARKFYQEKGGADKNADIAERQSALSTEKKESLDKIFYGHFQGAIGQEDLWHALQRLEKQMEILANNGRGWISHRDMAAYYQTQEVTQLMRNAPAQSNTRAVVPQQKDLYPLRKMQADTISLKGMPSGGFTGVVNIVDLFSQFSWQVPVQSVGRASSAAAAVNAAIKHIEDRYSFPHNVVLQTDNGSEFSKLVEDSIDERITVTHGPAFTSNAQGAVENSNKICRGVMRRLLHAKGAKNTDWAKYMTRINEIARLAQRSPSPPRRAERRQGAARARV